MGTASTMAASLQHRGPDSYGLHVDERSGLALAHRRLAVLDLGRTGDQPMLSRSGRYALALNGEIYNFSLLKTELEAEGGPFLPWRGTSDTEVLLAAMETWGVENALRRILGMFAFALWDSNEQRLYLARDRMGEKPIYWSLRNGLLLFGSEAKALTVHPAFRRELNSQALTQYLRYQYIPAPMCIWDNVFKLEPGNLLSIDSDGEPELSRYWALQTIVQKGRDTPFDDDEDMAGQELETLLKDAVRLQLNADVPLGTLLSGGIDSSLITALAQSVSDRPIKTFTIGYEDPAYDESGHARQVAEHLGTHHTELIVSPQRVLDLIPRLADIWDEPFADASMLPTALVSQLTREHVTICLTGDGGDESFGGYNRHVAIPPLWEKLARLPQWTKHAAASTLLALRPQTIDTAYSLLSSIFPRRARMTTPGVKAHKLAGIMSSNNTAKLYTALCSTWPDIERLTGRPAPIQLPEAPEGLSFAAWMQYMDTLTYLPGDILTKIDRASMAFGLEARAPFLDHRVLQFAWSLPDTMKISGGSGKRILRTILDRHVPHALTDRPKTGFGLPLGDWLRGPLREWVNDMLRPKRIERHGIIDSVPVLAALNEHMSGRRNNEHQLWNILMLQSWLDRWM